MMDYNDKPKEEAKEQTLSSIFIEEENLVPLDTSSSIKNIKISESKPKKKQNLDIGKLISTKNNDILDPSIAFTSTTRDIENKIEPKDEYIRDNVIESNLSNDLSNVISPSLNELFYEESTSYTSDDNIELNYNDLSDLDMQEFVDNYNRYWPIVEQVLRIAGSDTDIQKIAGSLLLTRDTSTDAQQKDLLISSLTNKLVANNFVFINTDDVKPVLAMVYDEMIGISVLGNLWREEEVTEIMVDRWDRITVEKNGKLYLTPLKFRSQNHAESVARNLANRVSDRALSNTIPLVTSELPGARITFAYGQVVKGGISITLRKFRNLLGMDELLKRNTLNNDMAYFLKDAVTSRAGILISGGTGTGKTTIINLLSSFIPTNERVITIEDAFELQISANHVVSLQTKEASSRDDQISINMADLMINTLRMRPDRIIVGEIREGKGANVMLTAANTGHDGTMTTIHASSTELALNERLVDLVREERDTSDAAIKRTIVSAFELVVQVSRGRRGQRYISEIALVDRITIEEGNIIPLPIFLGYEDESGNITHEKVNKVPEGTILFNKLIESGINPRKWG